MKTALLSAAGLAVIAWATYSAWLHVIEQFGSLLKGVGV